MEKTLPEIRLYLVDDTQYCSEEFKARCGGKVQTAYIFNANSSVHCCEITPSYEMWPLTTVPGTWPDQDEARDKLDEELRECTADAEIKYYHVRTTKLEKAKLLHQVTETEWNEFLEDAPGDTEKERIDNATCRMMHHFIEYYTANPPAEAT
jgi:hypothetical protein